MYTYGMTFRALKVIISLILLKLIHRKNISFVYVYICDVILNYVMY